jgi:carbamoyl-phosphate synthase large subunit
VNTVTEGHPNIVDMIVNEEVDLIVNTSEGAVNIKASASIRREALMHRLCYTTTMAGAFAMVEAMNYLDNDRVTCLQTLHLS